MPPTFNQYDEYMKINFEFDGRELTAWVDFNPESRGDFENKELIFEITDIVRCEDTYSGEVVRPTEGMKAAILFALRSEAVEIEQHGETELRMRFFKSPGKK